MIIYGTDYTMKEIILMLILFYIILDLVAFLINVIHYTERPPGCAKEGWIKGISILNRVNSPSTCPPITTNESSDLGKWRDYARKDSSGVILSLNENDVDKIVNEQRNNYVIEGYNPLELFGFIILPTLTVICAGYALIISRADKAKWTFWILVITLTFTGFYTVVNDKVNIDILPTSKASSLSFISDKLGLLTGDELQYTLIARKQDGTNCMIEGTFIGTPDGGIESELQPTIYRGDNPNCSASKLELY